MTFDDWLAIAGVDADPAAVLAATSDWCEERGLDAEAAHLREDCGMVRFPGEVGQEWLVCTVTLYYVGKITEVGLGYIRMEKASWIHWTGRLSVLTKLRRFVGGEFGNRSPRVEPCGDVVIATNAIVAAYGPPWQLPEKVME